MNQAANAPVFVVGYMHSGTTLLHNILAAHPSLFSAADETRYFAYLPLLKGLYPDLDDSETLTSLILMLTELVERGQPDHLRTLPRGYRPAQSSLDDAEVEAILAATQPRTHGVAFRATFDYLTARAGKTRWIEKTPQHVFLVGEILHSVPAAQFVEILRDPRDILASKKKRTRSVRATDPAERRVRQLERVYDPFWDALEWRFAVRAGQRARAAFPDRLYTVRYEDLVQQPEATIQGVCAFLGLDFVPQMLDVRWWNTAEGDRSDRKGIVSDALGRWAQTLSPAEVGLAQRVTGAVFRQVGYVPAPVPRRAWPRMAWLTVRAAGGLIDRLIRRWRLGGPRFLLNTLVNYAKALRGLTR